MYDRKYSKHVKKNKVKIIKEMSNPKRKWARHQPKQKIAPTPQTPILVNTPVKPPIDESTNDINFEYDICIVITTYNRGEMLKLLLDDIIKNSHGFRVIINIFDDGSDENFDLKPYQDKINIIYTKYNKNHGKKKYWKLISDSMNFCRNVNSKYFIYLPDDVRLINKFFTKSIRTYESINDTSKISLSLLSISGLKEGGYNGWTSSHITKKDGVYKTQSNDLCFISKKRFFEELNYKIDEIPENTWDNNPNLSSGVGSNISKRLHNKNLSMYHVRFTFVIHTHHESKMHYLHRKNNKIVAINKIAICIPIYKRPEITKFVLNYYKNLKQSLKNEIELILICAGSEGNTSKKLAEKNGFIYVEHPNEPLSQKQNAIYKEAKKYNPDACIKIDSDSIISIEFFRYYNHLLTENFDYGGITDIHFLTKKYLCYWGGYEANSPRFGEPTGVGRFMSKDLLNELNWCPWGDLKINSSLDGNLSKNIKKLKNFNELKLFAISSDEVNGFCVDLKSNMGISNIDHFKFSSIINIDEANLNIDFSKISNKLLNYNPKL